MGGAWADLTGALFIFHGTHKQAEEFIKKDPYVINGIVSGHETKEWNMVVTSYEGVPTVKI